MKRTAEKYIGSYQQQYKQKWMTDEIYQLINKRRNYNIYNRIQKH